MTHELLFLGGDDRRHATLDKQSEDSVVTTERGMWLNRLSLADGHDRCRLGIEMGHLSIEIHCEALVAHGDDYALALRRPGHRRGFTCRLRCCL